MKSPFRPTPFLFSAFALAAALLAGPALAQDCVEFQGIDHCPVGEATLGLSEDGLVVQNQGGVSGVSSRFSPTVHWNGQMEFPPGLPHQTTLSSISGGETTSRLLIEPEGNGFRARATFTGASEQPTYSVLIYRDGVLQGALGGFDGSEPGKSADRPTKPATRGDGPQDKVALYVDGIYWGEIDIWWWWDFHFFIAPPGGCNWGMSFSQAVPFQLPNGEQVLGDQVVFAEDVRGDGHYPYLGFESIETATTAPGFTITDELAEGVR